MADRTMSFGSVFNLPEAPNRKSAEYILSYKGLVYSCIMRIAQEISTIQVHLFKKKLSQGKPTIKEVMEHESLALLEYVNDFTTQNDLFFITSVYKKLTGEAYWALLKDSNGKPYNIWPLRPDWVTVYPSKKDYIDHYGYKPWGQTKEYVFKKDEIVYFKDVNPANPYRGYGSVQATAISIDIMDYLQSWNRNFFVNSAIPNLIFTTDKKLTEETVKRFMRSWRNEYAGVQNSSKVGFLGGGLTPTILQQSIRDMDFKNLKDSVRDDILSAFGVPKSILGLSEDVNRASMQISKTIFAENTIKPELMNIVGYLNEFFLPLYEDVGSGYFFDFDDPTPEDTELKLKVYANALGAGGGKQWMTVNEIREEENLEPLDGQDEINVPVVPTFNQPQSEQNQGFLKGMFKGKPEQKSKRRRKPKDKFKYHFDPLVKNIQQYRKDEIMSEVKPELVKIISKLMSQKEVVVDDMEKMKEKYWRQVIAETDAWEAELRKKLLIYFERQEKEVIDQLYTGKGLIQKDVAIDAEYWRKELEVIVSPWMKTVIYERGRIVLHKLGQAELNMATQVIRDYITNKTLKLTGDVTETTINRIQEVLAEGIRHGEGIPKLKTRIEGVYENVSTFRTETIARTETLEANNFATLEAYKQSGVVIGKEWLTAFDERTCEWCKPMNTKVIDLDTNYFNKGDTFRGSDGGILKLDYKSILHPPLHANCRCTLIPIISETAMTIPVQKKIEEELDLSLDELEKIKSVALKLDAEIVQKKIQGEKEIKEIKEKAIEEAELEKKIIVDDLKDIRGQARKQLKKKTKKVKVVEEKVDKEKIKEKIKKEAKVEAEEEKQGLLGDIRDLREKLKDKINERSEKTQKKG